jgi:hypothetical protein
MTTPPAARVLQPAAPNLPLRHAMRRSALLILPVLLLSACAPRPIEAPEPVAPGEGVYPHHDAGQILAAMELVASRDTIVAFASQARLALRSPEQNADGTAVLRQRGADTLWASIRGPLNLEVARALVTPDSFLVHDRLRNQLVVGPAAAAQQLIPGPRDLDEALVALTGTLLPDLAAHWFVNAAALDGTPVYWLTSPDGRTRLAVDPTVWRVRRFDRLGPAGQVVDRRRYADFEVVAGRVLPLTVELSNPAADVFVTIEHRRLTLNPAELAFPFNPAGVPRVEMAGASY